MNELDSDRRCFSYHEVKSFLCVGCRAHIIPGVYTVEDLGGLVGTKLATMNPRTSWDISMDDKVRMG